MKNALSREGYIVIRSAASRSPFDLVAIREGEILLIQCSYNKGHAERQVKEFAHLSNRPATIKLLIAYKERGRFKLSAL